MVAGLDGLRTQLSIPGDAAVRALRAAAFLLVAACGSDDGPSDTASTPQRPPGYIVDSIHAPEEALRRFRHGIPEVTSLDGPHSLDSLVRRFSDALQRRDAAGLRALALSRAEFAYLVYPSSRISKPPYQQPPEIAWMLLDTGSDAGIAKLLNRASRLSVGAHHCPSPPEAEGAMRLWRDCMVTVRERGTSRDMRLFGRIVELDGRFKFASLDNDL